MVVDALSLLEIEVCSPCLLCPPAGLSAKTTVSVSHSKKLRGTAHPFGPVCGFFFGGQIFPISQDK